MTLIFSSGGGRLGNQLLNLIHLIAISYEYKIKIEKINDPYIVSKSNSIKYQIQPEKISWNIKVSNNLSSKIRENFTNKIYIRLIHAFFFLIPGCKSFKVGGVKNLPKFIFGRQLPYDYKIEDIINQSINGNVVIGGWGLRHWELVKKNKISIVRDFKNGLKRFNFFYEQYELGRFLFVHIRRTEFLTVNNLSAINFSDEIWWYIGCHP